MKLRVFEAFAGYGSQSIALELLAQTFPNFQYEVVGFSEIDRHAIKAYQAIHGDSVPNLGDISKINWGGITLNLSCLHIHFLAKIFLQRANNVASRRVAVLAPLYCGSAHVPLMQRNLNTYLWKM